MKRFMFLSIGVLCLAIVSFLGCDNDSFRISQLETRLARMDSMLSKIDSTGFELKRLNMNQMAFYYLIDLAREGKTVCTV
jgi:type II secretory pathway component PulM